ncbi:hypothetical protein CO010_03050 [Candidatus Shapirobacteria bacterium CG_4_8_14_3_um_filter_39_11]|uniref:Sodium/calcium exchanger membrane region domain-containing protein n=1 Tax=Candidatus Shapirobacteria bacterium CG_4_8_14_3_um_filter_39_11 TaxID=1974875 RepID=A0A2M8GG07_9BACT|nr:MAG: hypothetical protein CO010_03050 [Candidatus Shapirobacteria bacterium CG_4_8_14_3_um_filter_39_11]
MILPGILIYLFSFLVIWFGSRLIVSSVGKLSRKLKVSSFGFSFFVLGILTTIPELSVGLTAITSGDPEIFVGNLIGGVIVIFFLIIPLLAIFGNGIKLSSQLKTKNLLLAFAVMIAPVFLVMDKKINHLEGVIFLGLYFLLFYFIQKEKGILDNGHGKVLFLKSFSLADLAKILFGIGMVFAASRFIVEKTLYFAQIIKVSPFYLSLVAISLGTNLPELSVGIRSIMAKKKQVAFGDYIGSAAANTLLLGFLTVLGKGDIVVVNGFTKLFIIIFLGFGLFFYLSRSNNDISRKEGFILLLLYIAFIVIERH